ncbi:TPA: hypothetical protein ACXLAG_004499 [Pseudomonas aeruginosa]
MKKTLLTIAILTASAFANAEYIIKMPLEQAQGGQLPNGSIQIVKNDAAQPENDNKEELYFELVDTMLVNSCPENRKISNVRNCNVSGYYIHQSIPINGATRYDLFLSWYEGPDHTQISRIELSNGKSCVPSFKVVNSVKCEFTEMFGEEEYGKEIGIKVYK